eukprot:s3634_g5.t2
MLCWGDVLATRTILFWALGTWCLAGNEGMDGNGMIINGNYRQYHPDLNTSDRSASIKMAELTSAYDTLMDPKRRAALDQATAGAYAGAGYNSYTGGFPNFNQSDEWVSPSQMYSEYSDLFGRNSQFRTTGNDAASAQRGEDVSTNVEVPFLDAAQGCEKVISLRLKQVCTDCRGSGAREGTTWSKCRVCKGSGVHRQEKGIFSMGLPCQRCRGSGMVLDHPCRSCRGETTKMMTREIRVSIPAGVRNLMELRIANAGHAGSHGGKAGHLFVQVKVLPHERFRLVEDDVHLDVPLTLRQALLGAEVTIPTIEGRSERLVVQAPAQPGTTKVLRGRGPPRCDASGRGNLVLHFLLHLPRTLSPRQVELIEEFDGLQMAKTSYMEAMDRSKGNTVQVRGYWGDIVNSPYHAFCTRTDPEVRHRLFKINSQQYRHTETDIAEYNLTAACGSNGLRVSVAKKAGKRRGKAMDVAFVVAGSKAPTSALAPCGAPAVGGHATARSFRKRDLAVGGAALGCLAARRSTRSTVRTSKVHRGISQRPIFDPLNVLKEDEGAMKRAKTLELVLGRLAMLAVVGVPAAELWHDQIATATGLPNLLPENGQAPSVINEHSLSPMVEVVLVSGIVGLSALALEATSKKSSSVEEIEGFRNPSLSPMLKSVLREAQVFNGRVAMVAVLAIAAQEVLTGQATVDITPFLFAR